MTVTVRAAAKINLRLAVGPPREDGFHPLLTIYQAISLYDDVRVTHVLSSVTFKDLHTHLLEAICDVRMF